MTLHSDLIKRASVRKKDEYGDYDFSAKCFLPDGTEVHLELRTNQKSLWNTPRYRQKHYFIRFNPSGKRFNLYTDYAKQIFKDPYEKNGTWDVRLHYARKKNGVGFMLRDNEGTDWKGAFRDPTDVIKQE